MIGPALHPSESGDRTHLEFQGWTVHVADREMLRWVDLSIPRGRIVALVGPTGSGKSVLLSSVNRLLADIPQLRWQGSVELDGTQLWGRAVDDLAVKRRTSTLFRHGAVLPGTVFQNIAFPLRLDGIRDPSRLSDAVEKALRAVSGWERLRGQLDQEAARLTIGLRQIVNLARAMVGSPEILLLDEPCGDLDPRETDLFERSILDLPGETTVLLATHNLAQASRLPHRVAFFMDGQLHEFGPTDRVFQRPIRAETEDYLSGRFG
ncbi:MAG: ATP-binding cassette domain-containing protein [Fibrobacterota bacterium]|nr:ATP-binding cassette domain-containing protein [Fibrobacterota bacterium]QQS05002.1 MAG: ATP-binding cassette domain-containing protein [Fibrobacterota bacterium]